MPSWITEKNITQAPSRAGAGLSVARSVLMAA
jgi:hypothetical protein